MSNPGEHAPSLLAYLHAQDVMPDLGVGDESMGTSATTQSPFVIEQWKASQYKLAVSKYLPADISEQELADLDYGCHLAADRSTRYNSRQEESALTCEESAVLRILGAQQFMALFVAPPPAEMVDYMLSKSAGKYVRPYLESITAAVIQGRLEWEERFAEAGVPTPKSLIEHETACSIEHCKHLAQLYKGRTPLDKPSFWQGMQRLFGRTIDTPQE